MKTKLAIAIIAFFSFLTVAAISLADDNITSEKQVIDKLLYEVQQLRIDLKKTNQFNNTHQRYLENWRASRENLNRLNQALDQTKSDITELSATMQRDTDRKNAITGSLGTEQSPFSLNELKTEFNSLTDGLTQQQRQLDRLNEKETLISNQIQEEQAILSKIGEKLDSLERDIESAKGGVQ